MEYSEYLVEEFFDDNEVLEVCDRCLKIRITFFIWERPSSDVLRFFLGIKKNHTLTMCPCCLQEQFEKPCEVKKERG